MDILKRASAPITDEAWKEIDDTAREVFKSILSARKVIKVNGPKGLEYAAVPEGKLKKLDQPKEAGKVCTGTYMLKNLVEARVSFEVSKWELDNIQRGAKDPDLSALEDACKQLAIFEEEAIYNGYEKGDITGLSKASEHKMKLGKNPEEIIKSIGEGKYKLFESFGQSPFDLLVSPESYEKINTIYEGANLMKVIKSIIGGEIYRSKVVKGAVMIPHYDDDLEFTVGQDFAVGYEGDAAENVRLFVTESFTFRVLDGAKVINYS